MQLRTFPSRNIMEYTVKYCHSYSKIKLTKIEEQVWQGICSKLASSEKRVNCG